MEHFPSREHNADDAISIAVAGLPENRQALKILCTAALGFGAAASVSIQVVHQSFVSLAGYMHGSSR
jgi:hypothetical protein